MTSKWQNHDATFDAAAETETAQVPEGFYQLEVTDLDLDTHPRWNDEQLRWDFRVLAGPDEGAHLIKWHSLDRDRVKWLIKDCARLGVTFARFSELEAKRESIIGLGIEVEVKYKEVPPGKNWEPEQQIWFVGVLDGQAPTQAGAPKPAPAARPGPAPVDANVDDDVPF